MKNILFNHKNVAFLLAFFLFENLAAQSPPTPCTVAFDNCPEGSIIPILDCDNSGDEALIFPSLLANPSGNCTNFQMTKILGPVNGSIVPIGIYQIVFQIDATDIGSGATPSALCSFQIEIMKDLNPPVFTFCPPDITVFGTDDGTGNCTAQAFSHTPTATDECGNPTILCSKPCGSLFPKGQTTVTCTATDASGNPVTCSFIVTVICTVGSSEAAFLQFEARLFPNPAIGEIRVEWPDFELQKGNVEIVSTLGQTVRSLPVADGEKSLRLPVADLPEGIYFVEIRSAGRLLGVLKLVKQ